MYEEIETETRLNKKKTTTSKTVSEKQCVIQSELVQRNQVLCDILCVAHVALLYVPEARDEQRMTQAIKIHQRRALKHRTIIQWSGSRCRRHDFEQKKKLATKTHLA